MNKSELIGVLSDRLGGRPAATQAVELVVDTITRTVAAGEKVTITGFGVFEKADRAARTGRNPATGAAVKIKKTSVPKFRPGTDFKAVVSGARKLPKAAAKSATRKTAAAKTLASKAPARKSSTTASAKAPAKGTTTKKAAAKSLASSRTSATTKTAAAKKLASKAPAKKSTARKTR